MYRETWVGGTYGSYCTKNLCENWVLEYDALVSDGALASEDALASDHALPSDDASVFNFYS